MSDKPYVAQPFRKAVAPPSPAAIAAATFFLGASLAVAGVYVLAGIGWALIASSVPALLLASILIRGLLRAE